ncbi:putative OTU domain-containing protein [Rosa chinensis]|uniref:Putative OTU domain-containing protein n=1 Tax=Rosa chinensis TaxID=74649 RepID=A0A2P6RDS0_ROSCH|nr:OVARIAN TUMOR DOMAIN-containing deubiquitinating enzyme 4 isoform X2 [Rosa chinensis]PRQ44568.1 putative OTU domain-containing protein [Rosa chinensis]
MGSYGLMAETKSHAVCIPYPAQGHINRMLQLAKLLHHKGFHITFVNTEYNHRRLLNSPGPNALDGLPSFQFKTIPDGVPPTDTNSTQDIPALCQSTRKYCLPHFRELLGKLNSEADSPPVSCVVSDGVMSFTLDAAEELGVPGYTLEAHAEAAHKTDDKEDDGDLSYSHGKKVYTDYSIIGIPGDGRCMFRSVAHGACLRAGKSVPSPSLQRELADDLRARVADEFIKRREETEGFVEGDFDTYVSHIRKPHVWGGEPELSMASHVLEMPITVYMYDEKAGGLITIAGYGRQEYGKENPIRVLYHGFGHYDALQIPGKSGGKSKL